MRRLETSPESRRVANILSLVLIGFAVAFAAGGALVLLRYPEPNVRLLLCLQTAIATLIPLWMAYFIYLPAHTVLEFSSVSLRLSRSLPSREWSGPWRNVLRSSHPPNRLFAIRTTERLWPGWAIKVAPDDTLLIQELKRHLGPGVWLDRPHAKRRQVVRLLVLVHTILIALVVAVSLLEWALR